MEPPGAVSNGDLLLPDGFTPRSGLQKQTHYRGIVREVWDFFMSRYGGGPAIVRRTIDLYEDLDANRLRPRRRPIDSMETSATNPPAPPLG